MVYRYMCVEMEIGNRKMENGKWKIEIKMVLVWDRYSKLIDKKWCYIKSVIWGDSDKAIQYRFEYKLLGFPNQIHWQFTNSNNVNKNVLNLINRYAILYTCVQ